MSKPSELPQPTRFWHASLGPTDVPWKAAAPDASLCLHLNFQGEAELTWKAGQRAHLRSKTLLWTRGVNSARRLGGRERHECLTLVYPDAWLAQALGEARSQIPAAMRGFVTAPLASRATHSRLLTPEDRTWAYALMAPHLCEQARRLLDTARLTDFLVSELFAPAAPEAPTAVSRTERVARERVEKAKAELLRQLDEAPSLEALAVAAGCSPHYLSRTFAHVEGLPLTLWLRRERIERASQLLASGQCNVSEAALEVGYRSFSHFSRTFAEEKGVQPSKWVDHLGASAAD
ncbi:MAG: helix-turn-helix transcriptional regulator [Verrucomicrobiaceae bacterium]|nr:helix-turn-helix transcriptional regulator [Verrucomicrobiaceae bacterium]